MRRRVVVTGYGACTAAGGASATLDAMFAGRPMAAPIRGFETDALPVRFACEIRDADPEDRLGARRVHRMDRFALARQRPVTVPLLRQMLQEDAVQAGAQP